MEKTQHKMVIDIVLLCAALQYWMRVRHVCHMDTLQTAAAMCFSQPYLFQTVAETSSRGEKTPAVYNFDAYLHERQLHLAKALRVGHPQAPCCSLAAFTQNLQLSPSAPVFFADVGTLDGEITCVKAFAASATRGEGSWRGLGLGENFRWGFW